MGEVIINDPAMLAGMKVIGAEGRTPEPPGKEGRARVIREELPTEEERPPIHVVDGGQDALARRSEHARKELSLVDKEKVDEWLMKHLDAMRYKSTLADQEARLRQMEQDPTVSLRELGKQIYTVEALRQALEDIRLMRAAVRSRDAEEERPPIHVVDGGQDALARRNERAGRALFEKDKKEIQDWASTQHLGISDTILEEQERMLAQMEQDPEISARELGKQMYRVKLLRDTVETMRREQIARRKLEEANAGAERQEEPVRRERIDLARIDLPIIREEDIIGSRPPEEDKLTHGLRGRLEEIRDELGDVAKKMTGFSIQRIAAEKGGTAVEVDRLTTEIKKLDERSKRLRAEWKSTKEVLGET